MKKIILILLLFVIAKVNAIDLHVGEGQKYTTIQDAVDAASSGDKIIIHEGIYREEVRIAKDGITITSNPGDEVIVKGCIPLLEWTDLGDGVYSAVMDWDVTEGGSANQVFIDGNMIFNARWPDRTGNFVTDIEEGILDDAEDAVPFSGGSDPRYDKKIVVYDEAITEEPAERWIGANIYMNLSNPSHKKDGQGNTGEVLNIEGDKITAAGKGYRSYEQDLNWGIDTDTRYYLYNPKPDAVYETGGVKALLDNGEWWKNGDTLFVKTPDGEAPANNLSATNLVEAKKYVFVFRPEEDGTFSNVTIENLTIFGASITTEEGYWNQKGTSAAENNVFSHLDFKYIHHTEDCAGDWQVQWSGKSGFILSGKNNVLKNSKFEYSAASAISMLGNANKLFNCKIKNTNYRVTESGAVNFNTRRTSSTDHEVAYNTIFNTTHSAISLRNIANLDENKPGVARIHHNILHHAALRASDVGFMDEASENFNWIRIDHNILYGASDALIFGIYHDFGGGKYDPGYKDKTYLPARSIIDHNVIYDIPYPMGINGSDDLKIFNNTVITSGLGKGIPNGLETEDYCKNSFLKNNISQIGSEYSINAEVTNNVLPGNSGIEFNDLENKDFSLTENAVAAIDKGVNIPGYDDVLVGLPDLGAYEYGLPKWTAGASDSSYILTIVAENGSANYTGENELPSGTTIVLKAKGETGYKLSEWSGDASGYDNPLIVTMDNHKTITANFVSAETYSLNTSNDGKGTVSVYPDHSIYTDGSEIVLTAIPDLEEIFTFDKWTGSVPTGMDTINPLYFVISKNTDITATFKRKDLWYEFTETSYTNTFAGEVDSNVELEWQAQNDEAEVRIKQRDKLEITNLKIENSEFVNTFLANTIDISSNPTMHIKALSNRGITLFVRLIDSHGISSDIDTMVIPSDFESKSFSIQFTGNDIDFTSVEKIVWGIGPNEIANTKVVFEKLALGTEKFWAGQHTVLANKQAKIIPVYLDNGYVKLRFENIHGPKLLSVYDLQGRRVIAKRLDYQVNEFILGAELSGGLYVVSLRNQNQVISAKILNNR
jgi:hypothetical protein